LAPTKIKDISQNIHKKKHDFKQRIIRLKARTVDFEKVRDDGEGLTH